MGSDSGEFIDVDVDPDESLMTADNRWEINPELENLNKSVSHETAVK